MYSVEGVRGKIPSPPKPDKEESMKLDYNKIQARAVHLFGLKDSTASFSEALVISLVEHINAAMEPKTVWQERVDVANEENDFLLRQNREQRETIREQKEKIADQARTIEEYQKREREAERREAVIRSEWTAPGDSPRPLPKHVPGNRETSDEARAITIVSDLKRLAMSGKIRSAEGYAAADELAATLGRP